MSETLQENCNKSLSNSSLYEILKNCAQQQSYESLQCPLVEDFNDAWSVCDNYDYKMITTNSTYTNHNNGNISSGSYTSNDSFGDNILEENGRISLAYENLRTIPRKIADKFAEQTKFLDLSYNNFQNLSFLTFFEDLHTLILDRNSHLEPNTFPYLPNLEILWLNNCQITKITDWIQRIQRQCPVLRQLSIMGNPGTKNTFNFCSIQTDCLPHQTAITSTLNCRDYILNMLPNLEYLDGEPRIPKSATIKVISHNNQLANGSGKVSSIGSSINQSIGNGSSISDHHELNGRVKQRVQTSPTLSFKDLFQLKRRKKSYQSSSTTN